MPVKPRTVSSSHSTVTRVSTSLVKPSKRTKFIVTMEADKAVSEEIQLGDAIPYDEEVKEEKTEEIGGRFSPRRMHIEVNVYHVLPDEKLVKVCIIIVNQLPTKLKCIEGFGSGIYRHITNGAGGSRLACS